MKRNKKIPKPKCVGPDHHLILDLCILKQRDHIKCTRAADVGNKNNGSVEGHAGGDILNRSLPESVPTNSL